jgi:polyisoprenoid-binding protein YceI
VKIIASLLSLLLSTTVAAAPLAIDPATSKLSFTGDYGGEPIEGIFKDFSGRIEYDDANPLSARFTVEVQTASIVTGDDERDGYLKGTEWFAIKAHPTATFVTGTDCASFEGRLSCAGQLTLKGKTAPVTIEVQFSDGGKRLTGSAQFKRSTFAIGEGEWSDTDTIGDSVQVQFEVKLQ